MPSFLVPIRRERFSGSQGFSQLLAVCAKDRSNTELVQIKSAAELLLRPDGTTSAGYRLNTQAFNLVCDYVSPGLNSLCRNLWDKSAVAVRLRQSTIIQIYNNSVRLRGRGLRGLRLVLDKSNGVVVGAVGRNYRYLSNSDLLQMVSPRFRSADSYEMVQATLSNRDLYLLSVQRSITKDVEGISFRQGLAIFNSETTRQAIYLPKVVFDSQSRGHSFEPENKTTKLIHRKSKRFTQRLDEVLTTAMQDDDLLDRVASSCSELIKQSCFPAGGLQKYRGQVVSKLEARKITVLPTERVLSLLGSLSRPSKWDFYQSLVVTANDFRGSSRLLRTVAFEFLLKGKL